MVEQKMAPEKIEITVNGQKLQVNKGMTILAACKMAGIEIPSLCWFKKLNDVGACRVCVVEVAGFPRLVSACNTPVNPGMSILTNSPRVREARKTNLQLILSQHDAHCYSCVKSGDCSLQKLCQQYNILEQPYELKDTFEPWPQDFPLIRDAEKCIKCWRCLQVCEKTQGVGVWEVANSGSRTTVGVKGELRIDESACALCGQCITHCPVGALRERDDTERVLAALADPDTICLVQMAPAVRAAWGEPFGLKPEDASVKRLVASLRPMGFDYIFDTNFSADLTIMEEGTELLQRLAKREDYSWPMFTSCCPGWLRYIKGHYPQNVAQLSTAKSPQQMFGAVAKSYYAQLLGVDPTRIFSISIMPCLAKKHEAALENMNDAGAGQDVDVVLTTREVDRLIKLFGIDPAKLEDGEFDTPLAVGTGAAVIFGVTGGVMEAALRSAYYLVTGSNPAPDAFKDVRSKGDDKGSWREASFDLAGTTLKLAVASGLANAGRLLDALNAGEVSYDFVEIMACPGGCVGGGGQPFKDGRELAFDRGLQLYSLDSASELRFSHENPSVLACYADFLGEPCGEKAHHLLHSDHGDWTMPHA